MSGDVQPRKRKDKKRKKDDLGVDEPRGTSAALGEGDVFMHSHHEHGTGGHWCAKVIFFSLLFVLVGLIGLIILENRGLSELEANAVQSQYSGVLEGWLEDAPDDDHHDEHTLELTHHDDDDHEDHDDQDEEVEHSEEAEDDEQDDDEHDELNEDEADEDVDEADEDEDDEDDEEQDDEDEDDEDDEEQDDDRQDDNSQEQDLEANDEEEDLPYRKYYHDNKAELDDDEDEKDDLDNYDAKNYDEGDDEDEQLSNEVYDNEDDNESEENNQSVEHDDYEANTPDDEAESNERINEDDDDHEEEEEDTSLEVEKIEEEAPEGEEPISTELPALPEPDDDDDDNMAHESVEDDGTDADEADDANDADDASDTEDPNEPDDDFLEPDDDEPPVERITAPAGKPFQEVEEEQSSEKPPDTLAEEEAYEKRQEQLRKEEAEASHMWLKLSIGGALLVATHAIVRRATASSDVPRSEEHTSREATPPIDRRMTLIPEEPSEPVPIKRVTQESTRPLIQEVTKQIPAITKSSPTFEESEEELEEEEPEEEEPVVSKVAHAAQAAKTSEKDELYSDEEDADEDDVEEEPIVVKKIAPTAAKTPPKEPTPEPEEDVPDDVEIIDDEQFEEEMEEDVEDEEEISDVDDEELLTRLEAKYGRLPEPERPARRKDGGNSIEDEWPGEPADAYWRQQLDDAEREYNQGAVAAAAARAGVDDLRSSARARWLVARSLDAEAERQRDNALLGKAIAAYLELLKMNERLSDKKLLEIAERAINRIQFRGTYLSAEPVYRLLMRRFPDEPAHRTNLTVMFLMANRGDLAEDLLKETLKRWPNDRLALAQYGFILKTQHNRLEEALDHLQRALEGDTGPATEPRFYYHLGDTLLLLGRFQEAHEIHKRGAAHGHFLSPTQRSLYNVPGLTGRPWWRIEDTPYVNLALALEKNWQAILKEGEAAKASFEQEKEGLREKGEWSQLDLFVRGKEIAGRCARAPVTCSVVRGEAAAGCRRGQVKFSAMHAGTHVRPHVGPTNCRLRMHLGLSNTKDTYIRVDQEIRQWETGKVFVFDDSFEHEVWHNGTGTRLVLIVDVWHPELSPAQRRQLPAI